ncbi:hypothetical protein JEU22_00160 [Pseudomonas putida]|uniref:Uncharacterized protein n=1 Tax=Pseudomonas putida TaxID=303 RepID=A0A8I1EBP6_PSEPU|nr:hypothetical protein [Pseudomonas putida]
MRVFLDCEFTSMGLWSKLISIALVAENGCEVYLEPSDTWRYEDCSVFVTSTVLPQLWGGKYSLPLIEARTALLAYLGSLEGTIEIVTDSPRHDWRHFEDLIEVDGKWPPFLCRDPIDASKLEPTSEGADLPHHALLDARIIAGMFKQQPKEQ